MRKTTMTSYSNACQSVGDCYRASFDRISVLCLVFLDLDGTQNRFFSIQLFESVYWTSSIVFANFFVGQPKGQAYLIGLFVLSHVKSWMFELNTVQKPKGNSNIQHDTCNCDSMWLNSLGSYQLIALKCVFHSI